MRAYIIRQLRLWTTGQRRILLAMILCLWLGMRLDNSYPLDPAVREARMPSIVVFSGLVPRTIENAALLTGTQTDEWRKEAATLIWHSPTGLRKGIYIPMNVAATEISGEKSVDKLGPWVVQATEIRIPLPP